VSEPSSRPPAALVTLALEPLLLTPSSSPDPSCAVWASYTVCPLSLAPDLMTVSPCHGVCSHSSSAAVSCGELRERTAGGLTCQVRASYPMRYAHTALAVDLDCSRSDGHRLTAFNHHFWFRTSSVVSGTPSMSPPAPLTPVRLRHGIGVFGARTRDSSTVARAISSPMLTNHSAGVWVESGLADAMAQQQEEALWPQIREHLTRAATDSGAHPDAPADLWPVRHTSTAEWRWGVGLGLGARGHQAHPSTSAACCSSKM
jgi:hypothetical protein